jgi:hypothetical protein
MGFPWLDLPPDRVRRLGARAGVEFPSQDIVSEWQMEGKRRQWHESQNEMSTYRERMALRRAACVTRESGKKSIMAERVTSPEREAAGGKRVPGRSRRVVHDSRLQLGTGRENFQQGNRVVERACSAWAR